MILAKRYALIQKHYITPKLPIKGVSELSATSQKQKEGYFRRRQEICRSRLSVIHNGNILKFLCKIQKTLTLFVLTLTSSFRLLFTLYRRLFISFSLTNFGDNAASCTLLLKSSECAFKRFVILNTDFSHLSSLPSAVRQGFVSLRYRNIINHFHAFCQQVKYNKIKHFSMVNLHNFCLHTLFIIRKQTNPVEFSVFHLHDRTKVRRIGLFWKNVRNSYRNFSYCDKNLLHPLK